MIPIVDPTTLTKADAYKQAKLIFATSGRASLDPNWFELPENLQHQWHLWFDGGSEVHSATYSQRENLWREGPALTLPALTTGENVEEVFSSLLLSNFFGEKPKAIGVVFHVADEFAQAELAEFTAGLSVAEDIQMMRFNLTDEPIEFLADKKISEELTSWRLLYMYGAMAGQVRYVAVSQSRYREAFSKKLLIAGESHRIPVRIAITAAPLEALAAMPLIGLPQDEGYLLVMPYLKFTVVFALNSVGELVSMRSLPHKVEIPVPSGFGDILWNMAIRAEIMSANDPLVVLAAKSPIELQDIMRELYTYSARHHPLRLQGIDLSSHPTMKAVTHHHLEFLIYNRSEIQRARQEAPALANTRTFSNLWDWMAKQSFFNIGKLDAQYPTLADLRLMHLSVWVNRLLVCSLFLAFGYGGYSVFTTMNHPSWGLTPYEIKISEDRNSQLLRESQEIARTNLLMLPRSRGWVNLEFLFQLFPEDSGVRLDEYSYSMASDAPIKTAIKAPVPTNGAIGAVVGMSRTWKIKGMIKSKGLELLSNLNSQRGLRAFFEKVEKVTGDSSYQPDPSRLLSIILTQARNTRYNSQSTASEILRDPAVTYPFTFEAVITQKFADKDPLALPAEKPF